MAVKQMHYVYEWVRPDIGLAFYVGKGTGKRAYSKRRNKHTNDVISYLSKNDMKHEVRILANFLTKQSAFEYEIERIAFWNPLGELTNKTPGGEGGPSMPGELNPFYGRKHSAESIAKMSSALNGKKPAITGKKHKPESIEKMSAKAKGRPGNRGTTGMKFSDETKSKMRAAKLGKKPNNYGKKVAPEKTEKYSERMKKQWENPEFRAKVIRLEISEETRKKLSAATTAQWACPEKRPNRNKV